MAAEKSDKLLIGLGVAMLVLAVRLFVIQIADNSYKEDARNNSIVYETEYPSRGIIYDRNMNVLAENSVTYDIMVTPHDVHAFDTLAFARILDVEPDFIREKMNYYKTYRTRIGYKSQTFLKRVPASSYMRFVENEYLFDGFYTQLRNVRSYPYDAGGNLLGYISEVDQTYIKKHEGYKPGDFAGRTGIEAAREADLRGEKGYHVYYRDSRNKVFKNFDSRLEDKHSVPGKDIVTTIDAPLQQYGQELMEGKRGSLIAIEPATGEILALVSSPGINVNVLSDISSHYAELAKDPGKPMFNRAVQGTYPPGSVFKLVNGLIGLQEGVLKPGYRYPCDEGYYYTSTRKLGCHHHRSPLNLKEAVMHSCNSYFCYVLKNLFENPAYANTEEAFDKWREYVLSFGFGAPLGSDFPSELGGKIPTSGYYNKIYGRNHWRYSSVVSISIGQGEILATPLQIANLGAIMANRGWYIPPHIVKDSKDISIDAKYHDKLYTMIDEANFESVIEGMWMAVNTRPGDGGTATLAAIKGLDVCGKTGTAQNPHGEDNSVFICFAPRENPRIAVAAYIENAGFGATWACPTASLMVEKYLNGEIAPEREYLEKRVKHEYVSAVK